MTANFLSPGGEDEGEGGFGGIVIPPHPASPRRGEGKDEIIWFRVQLNPPKNS